MVVAVGLRDMSSVFSFSLYMYMFSVLRFYVYYSRIKLTGSIPASSITTVYASKILSAEFLNNKHLK